MTSSAFATSASTACSDDDMGTLHRPGRPAALFVLQRRPDLRLPAVDRHATVRRAELHARRCCPPATRSSSTTAPTSAAPTDYGQWAALIAQAGRPLGRPLRRRRSAPMVLRGLERAQPPGLRQRQAGGLFQAVPPTRQRRSNPSTGGCNVGGPATADNAWIAEFIAYCDQNDLPGDFVSTHHYPTDAFGKPGDDTETQLSESTRSVLRDEARTCTHAGRRACRSTTPNGAPPRTRAIRTA